MNAKITWRTEYERTGVRPGEGIDDLACAFWISRYEDGDFVVRNPMGDRMTTFSDREDAKVYLVDFLVKKGLIS